MKARQREPVKRKLIALGVTTASLLQSVRLMSNSVWKLDLREWEGRREVTHTNVM